METENRIEENNMTLLKGGGRGSRGGRFQPLPVKIVAGNKCDLKDARVVSSRTGLEWARKRNCGFMETSAREMVNIEETFARKSSLPSNLPASRGVSSTLGSPSTPPPSETTLMCSNIVIVRRVVEARNQQSHGLANSHSANAATTSSPSPQTRHLMPPFHNNAVSQTAPLSPILAEKRFNDEMMMDLDRRKGGKVKAWFKKVLTCSCFR